MHAQHLDQTVAKLKALPPERIIEVADFIDFLRERVQARSAIGNGEPSRVSGDERDFPVISVGQWPADFSLRRENMYGDDGR